MYSSATVLQQACSPPIVNNLKPFSLYFCLNVFGSRGSAPDPAGGLAARPRPPTGSFIFISYNHTLLATGLAQDCVMGPVLSEAMGLCCVRHGAQDCVMGPVQCEAMGLCCVRHPGLWWAQCSVLCKTWTWGPGL